MHGTAACVRVLSCSCPAPALRRLHMHTPPHPPPHAPLRSYITRRAKEEFHGLAGGGGADAAAAEAAWARARDQLAVWQRQSLVYQLYGRKTKTVMVRADCLCASVCCVRGGGERHALAWCAVAVLARLRAGSGTVRVVCLPPLRAPPLLLMHAYRSWTKQRMQHTERQQQHQGAGAGAALQQHAHPCLACGGGRQPAPARLHSSSEHASSSTRQQ
jgi:hypothetical protein